MQQPKSLLSGYLALILCAVLVLPIVSAESEVARETTIYIVRHSEKTDQGADPELSVAGQQRARELAHVLQDIDVAAIYVTAYKRSQQSALVLAQQHQLAVSEYPAGEPETLRQQVLAQHAGASVVVVAHSNTVAAIAAAFGVTGLSDLDESNYDRLWVVHHRPEGSVFQALRYGASSP